MSMCRVFSCVVGRGCLIWPLHSLGKTLLAFVLFFFFFLYSKAKFASYSMSLLTSHFCIPVPYNEEDIYLGVSSRRSCRSSWNQPFNFSFFSITGQGIDLDYSDIEWFALAKNRDHSVIFEISSKYWILDSFVDYDGCSISFKGFLTTVIDIIVIWGKFTHSSPF